MSTQSTPSRVPLEYSLTLTPSWSLPSGTQRWNTPSAWYSEYSEYPYEYSEYPFESTPYSSTHSP
jgi:hypothetical protein